MSAILAIDPGTVRSAWLLLVDGRPLDFAIVPNAELADSLRAGVESGGVADVVVIEEFRSYGMPVGIETMAAIRWAGIFEGAAYPAPVVLTPRKDVVVALCGSARASDANVRAALLDRWGGKTAAIGRKAAPGPLYGIHHDVWSALAIAVTYDIRGGTPGPA